MAFATVDDLELLLGHEVELLRAELAVALASSAVAGYARIGIARATSVEAEVDGTGADTLNLPEWPVQSVDQVAVVGTTAVMDVLDGPDGPSARWGWSKAGVLTRYGGVWPHRPRSVKVTYTHGYDPVPDGIRAVTLQAAARAITNPVHLAAWSGDSTTATFADVVFELTDGEKQLVAWSLR